VWLASLALPFSRSQLKRRIEEGEVRVAGAAARPSRKLRAGEPVVFVPAPPAPAQAEPEPIPLAVLHEDAHLVVVDKPAGMVVHPAAGHARGTLVNALLARGDLAGVGGVLRPGIVHRLDRDTSGVLVAAKDDPTHVALAAAFKAHAAEREYWAIVVGTPPPRGRFDTCYGRHPVHRKRFSSKVPEGKRAVTEYRVLERLPGATLVQATLHTGRTHQVRVHFADHGWPVLGDPVYGRPPRDPALRALGDALGRQALHARRLAFAHPATGERLDFVTDPPPDFQRALAALRQAAGA
jgi:23S rRNA pseudouridine1911/1915/1917 synthase